MCIKVSAFLTVLGPIFVYWQISDKNLTSLDSFRKYVLFVLLKDSFGHLDNLYESISYGIIQGVTLRRCKSHINLLVGDRGSPSLWLCRCVHPKEITAACD